MKTTSQSFDQGIVAEKLESRDTDGSFLGHEPPTREEKQQAVLSWRRAAEYERFRVAHGLCCGHTCTAEHNAELYERIASEIEKEVLEG